jgi:Neuraminidase (sialidase)
VKFGANVRLNDDTGSANQMETMIAAGQNGRLLVSWVDYRSGLNCGYTYSTDGGATWAKNFLIKPMNGNITGDATVSIDASGMMYAVCQDYGISQIRLSTSTDDGATWSAPQSIQSAPDKPWIGTSPSVAGTGFVTWLGNSAGIRRTTDGGKTWGPVHALEFLNHGTTLNVGSSGVVHVAFSPNGGDIRYARSQDLGDTWAATRTIGQTGTFSWENAGSRQHPIMGGGADPTGKYAAITWAAQYTGGEGDDDIWVIYTSDSGGTWTKPIKVNDNKTKSRQFQPWVAVDAIGRMHVTWTDARNGKNDTYYARSLSDPTKGFEANVQVNDMSGNVAADLLDYKGIAVQGSDVVVVFSDTRRGNNDIFFAKAAGAAAP